MYESNETNEYNMINFYIEWYKLTNFSYLLSIFIMNPSLKMILLVAKTNASYSNLVQLSCLLN